MPRRFAVCLCLLAAALCLVALCATAQAQDKPQESEQPKDLVPAGKISFTYTQAAFIVSGSGGKGTLTFNKKKHKIRIGGLGLGGFGGSSCTAVGEVYNMKKLEDFPGTYFQARMGYALGDGKGSLWLKNSNGVTLKLDVKTKGVALSLGGDGMVIRLDDGKK